jgi:hypothetical protein
VCRPNFSVILTAILQLTRIVGKCDFWRIFDFDFYFSFNRLPDHGLSKIGSISHCMNSSNLRLVPTTAVDLGLLSTKGGHSLHDLRE